MTRLVEQKPSLVDIGTLEEFLLVEGIIKSGMFRFEG